ncbi:E3 ubiquitin-protein ligase MARCHF2 [Hylobates moloch]|uniref:E3 ubiquitin-protein ligase MARCHF2 n=1 Tax=Hylobates moloch TaxID=81572 RepID=UPI002674F229|nr:E3 ubiquitin-protein ligase MARCHF2 [Hylobates moloch]
MERRAGRARRLASAGERRSLLARGAVGSEGGARTLVPAGAELVAPTGRAGPGRDRGRGERRSLRGRPARPRISDGPFCRICHEGANGECLLSPCGCTGTLGAVHKSCLERWLSSSNTSYCELCHTEFAVEKRPRPLTEWLKDPGPRTEKRTLCCDMVCFLFITPLAAISGWLCLRGAQDHLRLHSQLEAVGLIALTIALFTIYVLWTLVSGRTCAACIWSSAAGSSRAKDLAPGLWGTGLPGCLCLWPWVEESF